MIISVGAEKGGVGKSTVALQLAGGFAHKGKSVCILDVDTGDEKSIGVKTSINFVKQRDLKYGDQVPKISAFMGESDDSSIRPLLELSQQYDVVILDNPGKYCESLNSSFMIADVVLLLSEESKLSYPKIAAFTHEIEKAEKSYTFYNSDEKKANVLLVLNRVEYNKKPDLKRVHKFYANHLIEHLSMSSQAIKSAKEIRVSIEDGLTVYDDSNFNRSGTKASFDLLISEILGERKPRFVRGQAHDDYLKKILEDEKIEN